MFVQEGTRGQGLEGMQVREEESPGSSERLRDDEDNSRLDEELQEGLL